MSNQTIKIDSDECITVAQLKKFLENCPDIDEHTGEPYEIWLDNKDGTSSECWTIYPLNQRQEGQDIILGRYEE